MAESLTFDMDENVPRDVTLGLCLRHIPVVTAQEIQKTGVEDSMQLAYAAAHHYALVTLDSDYVVLHSISPHTGIFYFPKSARLEFEYMVRSLIIAHELLSS